MTNTKIYKAILIDLDDTLWDFKNNSREAFQDVYVENGLQQHFTSFEVFFDMYMKRNVELWDLYHQGKITKSTLQKERFEYPFLQVGANEPLLVEKIGAEFLQRTTTKTGLIPNTIELLTYLQPKYPLTILSNGFSEVQYQKMDNTNITHYFTHVVLSEHIGIQKPNIEIFEHALKLNNCTPEEVIMIGDNYEVDILGAKNALIDQIYFDPKGNNSPNEATHTVSNLKQIISIL